MNKLLIWFCSGVAALGTLILGLSLFYALAYGHGELEAGNFNHCHYWIDRDAGTGQKHRHWERKLAQIQSGLGSVVAKMDMWTLGSVLVAVGVGVWIGDRSSRRGRRTA